MTGYEGIVYAQACASKQILLEGDTPDKLLELVCNARAWAAEGQLHVLSNNPEPIACKAGCSYCCSIFTEVSVPEVLVVAGYILQTFSSEERERTTKAIDAYVDASRGLDREQLLMLNRPCPLLHENQCSVYPHRPLCCQRWHSRDAERCRTYAENPVLEETVQLDTIAMFVHTAVETGLTVALLDRKLPWKAVKFIEALKIALTDPDLIYTWRSKTRAFDSAVGTNDAMQALADKVMRQEHRQVANRPGWKEIQPEQPVA